MACAAVYSGNGGLPCRTTDKNNHTNTMYLLSLWVSTMSTSRRAVMPHGWGVKAGMVPVWVAGNPTVTHGLCLSILEINGLY